MPFPLYNSSIYQKKDDNNIIIVGIVGGSIFGNQSKSIFEFKLKDGWENMVYGESVFGELKEVCHIDKDPE